MCMVTPRPTPHPEPAPTGFDTGLAAAYAALLAYGTLFPFHGWRVPSAGLGALLAEPLFSRRLPLDIAVNAVIYLPFGLLMVRALRPERGAVARVFLAVLAGVALSFSLECLQAFLPARISSLRDVALNGAGAAAGAGLAWLAGPRLAPGRWLSGPRRALLKPGPEMRLGAAAAALWAASELTPLLLWVGPGQARFGTYPLRLLWEGRWPVTPMAVLGVALAVAAVAVIVSTVVRDGARPWGWGAGLVGAVLLLKVPVVGRQLTPDALLGAALGLAAAFGLVRIAEAPRLRLGAWLALFAAVAGHLQVTPEAWNPLGRWLPFAAGPLSRDSAGALAAIWPYLAVAYVGVRLRLAAPWVVAVGGALAVGAFAFGLEALQAHVPGRLPDAADPLLALLAWSLPWCLPAVRRAAAPVV